MCRPSPTPRSSTRSRSWLSSHWSRTRRLNSARSNRLAGRSSHGTVLPTLTDPPSVESPHRSDKIPATGEVDEWFKSHAWKACVGEKPIKRTTQGRRFISARSKRTSSRSSRGYRGFDNRTSSECPVGRRADLRPGGPEPECGEGCADRGCHPMRAQSRPL